ncbi:MAG TPA: Wzz/FepE/Etk N-terminal domain-containing protein [Acetobacterium sp.]
MEEISLQEILDLLRENWKMILAITVLFMTLAAVFTIFFIDKEYSSSTTLIVGKPEGYTSTASETASEVLTNQKLVGTYSEIAKSESVMTEVNKGLGLDMSDSALAKMVSVTTVNETELIEIKVTSKDPVLAATIANKTGAVFMTNVAELMKIDNLQVVDTAMVNRSPVSPNVNLNIAIAFLLGIVASVFIIFIRETLTTTVKTVEDLKKLIEDVPIVAIIPDAVELTDEGGR